MTEITINKYGNKILGYVIDGHTNYADYGEDIVCAAVSVLTQTALLSLSNVIKIDKKDMSYHIDSDTGYLEVEISKSVKNDKLDKAQIVFETLIVGLESIISSYPGYVTLEYGEV